MRNIDKLDKQALRLTAEKAKDNFMPNFMVHTRDVLVLLDELEAKDKQIADLKEAFRIALSAAGIDAPAAAGKGEAS
ncbi:TPA: hypothetical protein ACW7O9_001616 [Enterobacter hormaechei subsp. steigerwaltii]|nr:hypothetical protein [Enterobacter hormaechei]